MRPDWNTLPLLEGSTTHRLVNGCWIDREEYDVCKWRVVKQYVKDDGSTGWYWAAPLEALQEYGRIVHDREELRKAERRTRWEANEEWSKHIESMVEKTP